MLSFDYYSNASRLEILPNAICDFGSEPFLYLQAVGKSMQHTRKL